MKKYKVSSLLLGTFLMPVVSYGSADFSGSGAQFAGVVVSDAALFEAIKAQNINLVNYLLDHGANVNTVKILPEKGVSYSNGGYLRESTPLVAALFQENFEIVRLLLDRGANVNVILKEEVPGEFGYTLHHLITPLTIAIRLNVRHRNIINYIRLFLEKGADMNPGSGAMRVPLLEALTYHSCISDEPAESDAVLLLLQQPHIDFDAYQNEPLTFVYDEGREAYYQMEEGALAEKVLEAPKSLKTMIPNSLMLKTLQIVEQVLLPRMRAEGYQI